MFCDFFILVSVYWGIGFLFCSLWRTLDSAGCSRDCLLLWFWVGCISNLGVISGHVVRALGVLCL